MLKIASLANIYSTTVLTILSGVYKLLPAYTVILPSLTILIVILSTIVYSIFKGI